MDYMFLKLLHTFFATVWMGGMVILPIVFHVHNKNKQRVFLDIEKALIYRILLPSLVLLGVVGAILAGQNISVMRSDWFYLKIFILLFLLSIFAHFIAIVRADRIGELGYGKNFFINYAVLVGACFFAINYLLAYKPD
ncbi:MAG: CopD family protein [Campylobacteraceae bacterium]|nr:CopD family protein [Campylobacteraceae bacterium]